MRKIDNGSIPIAVQQDKMREVAIQLGLTAGDLRSRHEQMYNDVKVATSLWVERGKGSAAWQEADIRLSGLIDELGDYAKAYQLASEDVAGFFQTADKLIANNF